MKPQLIKATTTHRRLGNIANAFCYDVDYVLFDPEETNAFPTFFSHNRSNLMSIHDRDHGGLRNAGTGANWVKDIIHGFGLDLADDWQILLLAQPRILGTRFTPVSFWMIFDAQEQIRAVIAEVNNTFGDRHSYFCAHADYGPIGPSDIIEAQKVFHVSPFQPVDGTYRFSFSIGNDALSIRIDYRHASGGLVATLSGPRYTLTSRVILAVLLRRPFGAVRVLALIHWQALKLWFRRALFHSRPVLPKTEISQ